MSRRPILVAGATGVVGREVTRLLHESGHRVRAFSRSPARAEILRGIADDIVIGDATRMDDLRDVVEGADAVISCLGAPLTLTLAERRSYGHVDTVANRRLIRAAQRAEVDRFVYVAVHVQNGYADTAYVRAHEKVVDELRGSGLHFGVVRPTGIFSIFDMFVTIARYGLVSIPGDGTPRTNPVHQADVAGVCLDALAMESGASVSVGGPDVLTRDDIVRMAFHAVRKPPRILHAPRALVAVAGAIVRPFHPRIGELTDFVAHAFTNDSIGPRLGKRRLGEHFARVARLASWGARQESEI